MRPYAKYIIGAIAFVLLSDPLLALSAGRSMNSGRSNTSGLRESNGNGDPVPGVDVALEQNPGSVMKTIKVGADDSVSASGFTPNATVILTFKKTLKANAKGEVHWIPSQPPATPTDVKQSDSSAPSAEAAVTNTTRSNTKDN